jgi:hypothetical protein
MPDARNAANAIHVIERSGFGQTEAAIERARVRRDGRSFASSGRRSLDRKPALVPESEAMTNPSSVTMPKQYVMFLPKLTDCFLIVAILL